ncbi:hypothetical protein HMPREF1091_00496 [Atopobium minutum 10063974]|uniref:Uncharacterized protein n=2 Tax=Atopobium minutum TaxID=1381 RepID=N2BIE8_9ACTN|nr:hypothetical protein HMPREF1091_00496 [Atopobium minutum 10063974]SEB57023.1 hypothetical protein SAMN04489746_0629 [Atopobium minutum]
MKDTAFAHVRRKNPNVKGISERQIKAYMLSYIFPRA